MSSTDNDDSLADDALPFEEYWPGPPDVSDPKRWYSGYYSNLAYKVSVFKSSPDDFRRKLVDEIKMRRSNQPDFVYYDLLEINNALKIAEKIPKGRFWAYAYKETLIDELETKKTQYLESPEHLTNVLINIALEPNSTMQQIAEKELRNITNGNLNITDSSSKQTILMKMVINQLMGIDDGKVGLSQILKRRNKKSIDYDTLNKAIDILLSFNRSLDFDAKDNDGNTALMYAEMNNNEPMVKLLLCKNPNSKEECNETAPDKSNDADAATDGASASPPADSANETATDAPPPADATNATAGGKKKRNNKTKKRKNTRKKKKTIKRKKTINRKKTKKRR